MSLIQARVKCLTFKARISIYSNAVSTDSEVILGLFKALVAACESDSIFMI